MEASLSGLITLRRLLLCSPSWTKEFEMPYKDFTKELGVREKEFKEPGSGREITSFDTV